MTAKRILTIDDDPFYEKLYRDIFTAKGFEVKHAFNAAEGHELVRSFLPDLVTLDIMMPEKEGMMDGYGLLKELRCCGNDCQDVPVIMISALGEVGDIKRAEEIGATDFIPKQNLTPKALLDEVNRLLGQ